MLKAMCDRSNGKENRAQKKALAVLEACDEPLYYFNGIYFMHYIILKFHAIQY